jgi:hypothetical protein
MGDMFDIGGVLNAYTAGQQNRTQQMLLQRQIKREDQQIAREDKIREIYAKIKQPQSKGGDPTAAAPAGGIASPYAPPPDTRPTIDLPDVGAMPLGQPPAQPSGPQTVPSAIQGHPEFTMHNQVPQGWMEANQGIVNEALAIDPQTAFSLMDHFNKLDDTQRAQVKERADLIGQLALAADTPQRWDDAVDWAVRNGHPDLAAFKGQFSEQSRRSAIATAGLYDKFMEQTKKVWHQQGENPSFATDAYGNPVGAGNPAGQQDLPRPQSAAERDQLPPGTKYIAPDGSLKITGGSAPGRSNFPVSNGRAVIEDIFPGVHVTDNIRDPNSALGRANPDSWHNRSGGAVDVRPIPGMTFDQFVGRIRQSGYSITEQRDEVKNPSGHATGPHWHVVIGAGR